MKITDFYKEFNKIVSNHKSVADTKAKLTKLSELIKNTDLEGKVNINIDIAEDLEKQRIKKEQEMKNISSLEEVYSEEDDSYYDDSYNEDED